jgi:hypothetical protein
MEVNMVYEVKTDSEVVSIDGLKEKVMKKVDSLLSMPRTSPTDLKIISDIIKDLDVSTEEKLLSFYDIMLKNLADTNRNIEENALASISEPIVSKKVKEK